MAEKTVWIKADAGIRYKLGPVRKGKVKPDKYYVLRFTVDGKSYQEALGWESEGVTLAKARIELAKLKEAKRTGEGARSLRERRQIAEEVKKQQEIEAEKEKARNISFADFWEQEYVQTQSHKAYGSVSTEDGLWQNWIKPVLGEVPLCSLSASHLEKIKNNMLRQKKAVATIKYTFAVISQMWSLGIKLGLVNGICPVKLVALPKKDNKRQRHLSPEEIEMLLTVLKERSPVSHDMALISLDCGLRFGEIASLCWEDCNFETRQFLIRDPKARVNRYAFMTERVFSMLISRKQADSTGLIFLDRKGKRIVQISKAFREIVDELFNQEVTDSRYRVCFHTLRHTFASRLVASGIDLYSVKELMGHSDISMTQRYSHLSPEGLRNAIKVLEQ